MVEKIILSLGGLGKLKIPGTVASGVAVISLWLIREQVTKWWWLMPIKSVGLTIIGVWLIKRILNRNFDQRWIVLDELAGVTMAATAWGMTGITSWQMMGATFLLFRLFDGWKPGIIGKIDRGDNPWGVMLDDVLAGVVTVGMLWLIREWLPN